jgi:hypothetical protein
MQKMILVLAAVSFVAVTASSVHAANTCKPHKSKAECEADTSCVWNAEKNKCKLK